MVLLMQKMVQRMDGNFELRFGRKGKQHAVQIQHSTPPALSAPKSPSSLSAYFGVKEGWPVPLHKEWRLQISELSMRSQRNEPGALHTVNRFAPFKLCLVSLVWQHILGAQEAEGAQGV